MRTLHRRRASPSTTPASCSWRSTTPSRSSPRPGVGTSHLDGNTRLCTATASQALRETFGSRRPAVLLHRPGRHRLPASWSAATWPRRRPSCGRASSTGWPARSRRSWSSSTRARPRPPRRPTSTSPRGSGTNVALLNGLLHLLIEGGHIDRAFIDRHTVGFEQLAETVAAATRRSGSQEITGVPAAELRAAAELIGTAPTLVSYVLQGVYQSNQATAAACQVNNVNLVLGHDRQAGLRRHADERPADRPEHPRDRLRRRVPVLPQLAEPRPRRDGWPQLLERRTS